MTVNSIDLERLYGTWRLVESHAYDARGARIADPWGPEPMGRLVLDRGGRMMAVLCDGRTAVPDGGMRKYSSYCGNYRVEGDLLTTTVDAASAPGRIGSEEPRRLEFRGDRLVLKPPRQADGEQREIFWVLEAKAPQ